MTVMIEWPSELPAPLISGYSSQVVDPQMINALESRQNRTRRMYTSTPVNLEVSFIFDSTQAELFESFYQDTLADGVRWFNIPLLKPSGWVNIPVQFQGVYSGPEMAGAPSCPRWKYTATLQQFTRDALSPEPSNPVPLVYTGIALDLNPSMASLISWELTEDSMMIVSPLWPNGGKITLLVSVGANELTLPSEIIWTETPVLNPAGYTVIEMWKIGTVIYGR